MRRIMLWSPPLALLFACSDSAVTLQPGLWQHTVQRIPNTEVQGASLAARQTTAQQSTTASFCLSPEQAADPDIIILSPVDGQNCQFTENTFSDGIIGIHGTCRFPGGGTSQETFEGSYTATTMEVISTSRVMPPPGSMGPQLVTITKRLTRRRTGDCSG